MPPEVEYRAWPRDPRYRAGSDGSVVGPRGWPLVQYAREKGYRTITVGRNAVRVHRVVCETFHGPAPAGTEVAHRDGDPSNNAPHNLRWVTSVENNGDKADHGRVASGERNGKARLTAEIVRALRIDSSEGVTFEELARRYGVAPDTVADAVKRKTWRHVA